jgi:hypothetical protein
MRRTTPSTVRITAVIAGAGRMAGEARFRVRYGAEATPWFDWLLVSPEEMEEIVAGTGWELRHVLHDEANFVGVIERD